MTESVFKKAERKQAKLRLGVCGTAGSGKSFSSLLLASGLVPWEKIAVIDSENRSSELYAHLGAFFVAPLIAPYTPERYIELIHAAEKAGFECIIIDSLSHAWSGEGGLLEQQGQWADREKNSYAAWRHVTPSHNRLIDAMLQSSCHIVATMRSKSEYTLVQNERGKMEPKKLGLAPVQRDGMDYEFTTVLDIDSTRHEAKASKDRTGLFIGKDPFIVNADTGRKLKEWLETGVEAVEDCYRCAKKEGKVTPSLEGTKAETGYALCGPCLQAYKDKNVTAAPVVEGTK